MSPINGRRESAYKGQGSHLILVINPGSTSTKLALFNDLEQVQGKTFEHTADDISGYARLVDQEEMRFALVLRFLLSCAIEANQLDAVIGRGGLLRPIEGGVYAVNGRMLEELRSGVHGEHASNLGAILAARVSDQAGSDKAEGVRCPAFIADPVVVDELCDEARISGMPQLRRRSVFHALNQRRAAREAAGRLGKRYEEVSLIIAHLGGGISVGAHAGGRVIDVNNALDGDGPFSPERSGGLPAGDLVRLALSGRFSGEELQRMICGRGGVFAYTGSKDVRELVRLAESGDEVADLCHRAMAYQVAKEIGWLGAVLAGRVDGIVLTGGIAYSEPTVRLISERVAFMAPVMVIPGEFEMLALAENALTALRDGSEVKNYV